MRTLEFSAKPWMAMGAILFAGLFLTMCNTVEPVKVGGIDLQLNDSLTVEAGRYDSLEIDILETSGTMRIPKAFHGRFSRDDQGKIRNIPLGENPPSDFHIQLRLYKNGELVAIYAIEVTGNAASALLPVPIPPVSLISLAFEPATLSLQVGETSPALLLKANPANASNLVRLSVNDTSKAAVLPGNRILAKAAGSALVTATSMIDVNITAELALTIQPATGKPLPRSILISRRSLILAPAETADLDAQILPDSADQGVTWKSDHPAIVEVAGGTVTAKSAGKTFVRATSAGLATIYDSIPVEVVVPRPFDSVRISRAKTRFYLNGAGQQVDFGIWPPGSGASLTWTTGDAGMITVDPDGSVTARSEGTTWIKAAGVGFPSLKDSMEVTVVKDAPRIDAGTTRSVDLAQKVTFNVSVDQEFGGLKYLRWDLDGDGTFEGSAASVPAIAEITYPPERREYLAVFKAEDTEGNTDSISVRVRVGFNTPLIIVTRPTRDTLVRSPEFTVAYTVDGTPKTQDFILTLQGRNRLVITETKATGTDSAIVFVTLDSKPPVVRIQSPVPGLVTNRSTLRVDWTVDSIPQVLKTEEDISAREGEITITRDAVDAAGNPGTASVIIVRDITKPRIAIVRPRNGDTVSGNQVAVEWTVDEVLQTTQLTEALPGADGDKFITRRSTDAAGNTDSVTIKVTLDASKPAAPAVTVDVTTPTKVNTPTWSWTATGAGTGDFQYKLDDDDFATGATATRAISFKPATPLTDGVHTFHVREKDAQGAWGLTGSSVIEVDTKPAVIAILAPAPGARITSSPVTVTWTVDGGPQQSDTETLTGVDGARTITRTGSDRAGNTGTASVNVVLDLARPATPVILTPATSPFNTRTRRPAWTWRSGGGDAGGGFRYQLGTGAPVELPGTAFTPATDLADGTYTLRVAEKDAQGNWSTDAVSTVTIKGSPPAAPSMNVNAAISNAPRWSWGGTLGATFGYKLGGASTFISEGIATSYQPTVAQMADGLRTICVSERDIIGYGAETCRDITVDRTDPAIALTSSYSAEMLVTSVNLAFTGTVSDANLDRVECRAGSGTPVNATLSGGNWSCTPPLADGTHNVTFTAFDRATNSASASTVTVHKHSKVKFVRRSSTGNGSGTSWANAYTNIEDVLKTGILSSGDSVWISRAVYPPRSGFQTYVFTSNTTLLGGFSNTGAPSSRTAAIPGNVTEIDPSDFMIGEFDAPITNLRLHNLVFNGQMGVTERVYVTQSTGILFENCTFKNFMGDVPLLIRNESEVTVRGSYFLSNWIGTYGAICVYFDGGSVDISNTEITGNTSDNETYSGGVTIFGGSSANISNSSISGNRVPQKDQDGNIIGYLTVNMYVSGRLDHSSLTITEGGSSVRVDGGVIAPPIP